MREVVSRGLLSGLMALATVACSAAGGLRPESGVIERRLEPLPEPDERVAVVFVPDSPIPITITIDDTGEAVELYVPPWSLARNEGPRSSVSEEGRFRLEVPESSAGALVVDSGDQRWDTGVRLPFRADEIVLSWRGVTRPLFGSVKLIVTDRTSGRPVPGCVPSRAGSTEDWFVGTDASGEFVLSYREAGTSWFRMHCDGYLQPEFEVNVIGGETVELSVALRSIESLGTGSLEILFHGAGWERVRDLSVDRIGEHGLDYLWAASRDESAPGRFLCVDLPAGTYTVGFSAVEPSQAASGEGESDDRARQYASCGVYEVAPGVRTRVNAQVGNRGMLRLRGLSPLPYVQVRRGESLVGIYQASSFPDWAWPVEEVSKNEFRVLLPPGSYQVTEGLPGNEQTRAAEIKLNAETIVEFP